MDLDLILKFPSLDQGPQLTWKSLILTLSKQEQDLDGNKDNHILLICQIIKLNQVIFWLLLEWMELIKLYSMELDLMLGILLWCLKSMGF